MRVHLIGLFSILLFSCKKEKEKQPSLPEIINLSFPERVAVLSPVHFRFEAKADAGLERITIKHVVQDALITKSSGFKSATFDQVDFSHTTGFESINQLLKYEIKAIDKLSREAVKTIEIKVDNSVVDLVVEDNSGRVSALALNQNKTLHVTATSTSSLFSLAVYKVLKSGVQEIVFFKNNIQFSATDFIQKEYKATINIIPDENTKEFQFHVEDNAGVKKQVIIPVT